MQVKEDDDAILDCSFGDLDIKNGLFDWMKDKDNDKEKKDVFFYSQYHRPADQDPHFKGRVFHFPDQLQFGNASIVIRKTKTSDSGTYTCSSKSGEIRSSISLTVGAAPKPSVTILDQTQNSALLQCEVLGASPKPEVVWKDGDGKILTADEPKVTEKGGNKYDTVLNITVTKTDHYTCVATQDSIHHQSNRTIFVRLN
ncbi:CD276 antigen-like, partial [Stegastes partitus]